MKKGLKLLIVMLIVIVQCTLLVGCTLSPAGKSAYEIAVENGFVGTVEEWLDSLKGDNGKDGEDGKDGKNGTDGESSKIDINGLYEAYLTVHPDATFAEFLEAYMVVESNNVQAVTAKALKSVVSVYAGFRDPSSGTLSYSAGAGVIYKIAGGYAYIITNYHVVYESDSGSANGIADEISLLTYGKEYENYQIPATFIGGSISKDIAVVMARVSDLPTEMRAADIADSNQVTLGEQIVAVGNPLSEGISITSGIVSVDSENIEIAALDPSVEMVEMRVIRIDASVNRGNSGGGLFNSRGELLGIVNAKVILSGVEGVAYAIPSNVATGIAESVISNNSQKGLLGVTVKIASIQTIYNSVKDKIEIIETIEVDSVNAGGAADGVLRAGDKLISVKRNSLNELFINRLFYLSDYLYNARIGDKLTFKIVRNGVTMEVTSTMGAGNFARV